MANNWIYKCHVEVQTKTGRLKFFYDKWDGNTEIHFKSPFSNEAKKQITEIELFNINVNDWNRIQVGDHVELWGGFNNDIGLIMQGTIFKATIPTMSEADTSYKLLVLDGEDYTKRAKLNLTFGNNTKASTIIRQVANSAGINLNFVSLMIDKNYNEGFTADDHPMDVLNQLAQDTKSSLFYLRGRLTFRYIFDKNSFSQFDLSNETGLIELPTRESRNDDWEDFEDDDDGLGIWSYNVKCIFNYRLTTFAYVNIKSRYLNTGVKVTEGEHTFDGVKAETSFTGVSC